VRRRQFALVVEAEPTGNEDILIRNFACAEDHNPCFHLVERMADSVLPSPSNPPRGLILDGYTNALHRSSRPNVALRLSPAVFAIGMGERNVLLWPSFRPEEGRAV
jgi:hypothetical protein